MIIGFVYLYLMITIPDPPFPPLVLPSCAAVPPPPPPPVFDIAFKDKLPLPPPPPFPPIE